MADINVSNIYYNIHVLNDTDNTINGTFNENRVVPIITDPTEYEVTVARFSIPSDTLGIFTFEDGHYIVAIEDKSTNIKYDTVVQFIPQSDNFDDRRIYSYQAFLTMINSAYQTSYLNLKAANPANPITKPPFFSLDPNTGLFILYCEKVYTNALGADLYCNWSLENFISGFPAYGYNSGTTRFKFILIDNGLNTVNIFGLDYLENVAEYSTLFNWSDVIKLELQSNIPIESELVSGQKNISNRLLMDFLPNIDVSNGDTFIYIPTNYRWYDMISKYPLTTIDCNVVFRYKDNSTKILQLSAGQSFSIKILFRKKLI